MYTYGGDTQCNAVNNNRIYIYTVWVQYQWDLGDNSSKGSWDEGEGASCEPGGPGA